jgi:hypothetical protein
MTDLEIVLLIAFAIMTLMYWRAERKRLYMSCALVAVGLKEAYIEVDEDNKTFSIKKVSQ